jgi:hypothetical protein
MEETLEMGMGVGDLQTMEQIVVMRVRANGVHSRYKLTY